MVQKKYANRRNIPWSAGKIVSQHVTNWRVGVFGTEYDQEYIAHIVEAEIHDSVQLVSFLKSEGFGKDHDFGTHENCIKAVGTCDTAFFFINKRYGGPYTWMKFWKEHSDDWSFHLSVTHAEYRKAKLERIPTLVFVHVGAWEEIKSTFLKCRGPDEERYRSIKSGWVREGHYVRDPEVLCFIREASRGIGADQLYQSWIVPYSDHDVRPEKGHCRLEQMMLAELRSQTPYVLRKLANNQYDAQQKQLRVGPTISYEFLKKNRCMIAREVEDSVGQAVEKGHRVISEQSNHIMIAGDANIGKTFFMIDLFGQDVEVCNRDLDKGVPVFFSFKDRPVGKLTLESVVSDEMLSHFSRPKYPFSFDIVPIRLYVDGIDEGRYIDSSELKALLAGLLSSAGKLRLIIAMRQEYYDWNYTALNSVFKGRIAAYRLQRTTSARGKTLLRKVLRLLGAADAGKESIIRRLIPNEMLQQPMYCIMAAYVLSSKLPAKQLNTSTLFDRYLELLAEHELGHVPHGLTTEDLYRAWQDAAHIVAWEMTLGKIIDCTTLRKRLIEKGHDNTAWERTHGALIECQEGNARFVYDSFLDSLTSRMVVDYLLTSRGTEEVLGVDCFYHRSVFVEDRFRQMTDTELEQVQESLFHVTYKHVVGSTENDIRIAANCIYLMGVRGRLLDRNIDIDRTRRMIRALSELTRDSFVYVGALFQLTRLGDRHAERSLGRELRKAGIRKRNIDFHLVYFGAVPPQRTFPPDIRVEHGAIDCSRLLDGLAGHFGRRAEKDTVRTKIDVSMMCDCLEIYHCDYSREDTLRWIERLDRILLSLHAPDRHTARLVEESKQRLSLTKKLLGCADSR